MPWPRPVIPRLGPIKEEYAYETVEVRLAWAVAEGERWLGAGEQFSTVDLANRSLNVWSSEQGIGRGLQPFSRTLDSVAPYAAGTVLLRTPMLNS